MPAVGRVHWAVFLLDLMLGVCVAMDTSETRPDRRQQPNASAPLTLDNFPYEVDLPEGKRPRPEKPDNNKIKWMSTQEKFMFAEGSHHSIKHAPLPLPGSPWPMPQHMTQGQTKFNLSRDRFVINRVPSLLDCDILTFNIRATVKVVFGEDPNVDPSIADVSGEEDMRFLNVTVLQACEAGSVLYPHLGMNESYELTVNTSGAFIQAREVWGAVRGLQTFTQLVHRDSQGQLVVKETVIKDFPRFPHRGVMIDTARHFINKQVLLENLELMAMNKMNVFHWHISDAQSFPFESKVFPELTQKAAFDPLTAVYRQTDVADVIEVARLRGIRVVPEFDTPGHSVSWGRARDYLTTDCYQRNKLFGFLGPLNPILQSTYDFLQDLYREILSVFKDDFVHLGGDEVNSNCWNSNQQIRNYSRRHNLTGSSAMFVLFQTRLFDILSRLALGQRKNISALVWEEVGRTKMKLPKDTILQMWKSESPKDIIAATASGLKVIASACWYFDKVSNSASWRDAYNCTQIDVPVPPQLFLGGEACLWTEYVSDATAIARLWPRSSAVAERLWSSKQVTANTSNWETAAPRLEQQVCRMMARGYPVAVASGPGLCSGQGTSSREQPALPRDALLRLTVATNAPTKCLNSQHDVTFPKKYVDTITTNALYFVSGLLIGYLVADRRTSAVTWITIRMTSSGNLRFYMIRLCVIMLLVWGCTYVTLTLQQVRFTA